MKIFYKFADGTTSMVEVNDEIGMTIKEFEREADKIQKREQRHCKSYDIEGYNIEKAPELGADDENLEFTIFSPEPEMSRVERLHAAIDKLKPSQKELIKAIFFEGKTQKEMAEILGINQSNVSRQLNTALKKLKKYF